jgi:hypothetical protein
MQIIKHKRVIITSALLIALYLMTYILNSISGGYWLKPVSGGSFTYNSGLSAPTAILWQPYYGYNSPYKISLLGWLYYPLIKFDRTWWHTNKDLIKNEHEIFSKNPNLKIHPRYNPEHPDGE